jgi:hypothetical protein
MAKLERAMALNDGFVYVLALLRREAMETKLVQDERSGARQRRNVVSNMWSAHAWPGLSAERRLG